MKFLQFFLLLCTIQFCLSIEPDEGCDYKYYNTYTLSCENENFFFIGYNCSENESYIYNGVKYECQNVKGKCPTEDRLNFVNLSEYVYDNCSCKENNTYPEDKDILGNYYPQKMCFSHKTQSSSTSAEIFFIEDRMTKGKFNYTSKTNFISNYLNENQKYARDSCTIANNCIFLANLCVLQMYDNDDCSRFVNQSGNDKL